VADIRPPFQSPGAQIPATLRSVEGPTRTAAQRAFFEAALGRAEAARATEPQAATARAAPAPPSGVTVDIPAEQPARYMRPGSLLDIKV
jgi:hypothetical protein